MNLPSSFAERFGLNAYAQGRYDRAQKWFERLEKAEPNSQRVLRNLGVIALAQGHMEAAEHYLRREEGLYGETWHRHRALADLYYSMGRREDAHRRYACALKEPEAVELGEGELSFLLERLAICSDAGRFLKSREALSAFSHGEDARDNGRTDEALSFFLSAVTLDPTAWPAMNNAAVMLLSRPGEASRALELFEKAALCSRIPSIEQNIILARESLEKEIEMGIAV